MVAWERSGLPPSQTAHSCSTSLPLHHMRVEGRIQERQPENKNWSLTTRFLWKCSIQSEPKCSGKLVTSTEKQQILKTGSKSSTTVCSLQFVLTHFTYISRSLSFPMKPGLNTVKYKKEFPALFGKSFQHSLSLYITRIIIHSTFWTHVFSLSMFNTKPFITVLPNSRFSLVKRRRFILYNSSAGCNTMRMFILTCSF